MHHDIEEVASSYPRHYILTILTMSHLQAHVFPLLAKRMPEFRENERHKSMHKLIHNGLDQIEDFVQRCKETPSSYKPEELRAILDSFRDPLYTHLGEEVYVDNQPTYSRFPRYST